MRCQVSSGGGEVGSGTGSPSRPNPGPDRPAHAPAGSPARPAWPGGGLGRGFRRLARRPASGARLPGGATATARQAGWRRRSASITGRLTPISASGTFHSIAVEPPIRRNRQPALRHHAVGGPHRIAGRAHGAPHPFAHAAFVAVLGLLDLGHQGGDAPRRRRQDTAPAPRARRQIRARRARRAPRQSRLRAGPAPWSASFCMRVSRSRAQSPKRRLA